MGLATNAVETSVYVLGLKMSVLPTSIWHSHESVCRIGGASGLGWMGLLNMFVLHLYHSF
jgi:hypothetical protein